MNFLRNIFIIIISFTCNNIYAIISNNCKPDQAPSPSFDRQLINHSDWNFIENKGQLSDRKISYYGHQGGVYLFCKPGIIGFVFTKAEKETKQISEATSLPSGNNSPFGKPVPTYSGGAGGFDPSKHQPSKIATNRADLILLNSNPSAQILASEQQEYYENYYTTGDADHGIVNVHTYKTITYKDIYPHIDLILHSREEGMKYEFVVYPGGKVSDIQIQWNGLESAKKLKDSKIEYSLVLGKMEESKPVSFQGKNIIESNFIKTDNCISFQISGYNEKKPLIIDPSLEWATYFGANQAEGNNVSTDTLGNIFMIGTSFGANAIITTSGAYQSTGSGNDAFLVKFNSKGFPKWATYFGGPSHDYGNALAIDLLGNVFITGFTQSDSGIATKGAYQVSNGDNGHYEDAYLAKFDSSGNLKWGTYLGGSGFDQGYGVAVDLAGNVYMSGYTQSAGIATKGSYKSIFGTGYDLSYAFLSKFTTDGKVKWITYFGGGRDGSGSGNEIVADRFGNIYFSGATSSDSGLATIGAYQTIKGYDEDAFLAKFNSGGGLDWATYFGGSGSDYPTGLAIDGSEDIYLVGRTGSDTGIAVNTSFQANLGGYGQSFLAKFNTGGALQWATYIGGFGQAVVNAVAADGVGNAFLTGSASSNSNITTPDGTNISSSGAFLTQFTKEGDIKWGSFFATPRDVGIGITIDSSENIFITGVANSIGGLATSGAYQTMSKETNNGSNAFLAKFSFPGNDAGIDSFLSPAGNYCMDTLPVVVQLKNYSHLKLDSVRINLSINGTLQPVYHWMGILDPDSTIKVKLGNFLFSVGSNKVKCWTSKPNGLQDSVPKNDTLSTTIQVIPPPPANTGPDKVICKNGSVTIGASAIPGNSYSWTSNPLGFISTMSNPSVSPLNSTVYYLTETDNVTHCANSNSVLVKVNALPVVNPGKNKAICIGDSATIGDTSKTKGYSYSWTSSPSGFSSNAPNATVMPSATTVYSLTVTDGGTSCSNTGSAKITVNPLPSANVGQSSYLICTGTHIKIGANAKPGIIYSWTSSPTGFKSSLSNPVVSPGNNTVYYLSVTDTATKCVNKNFADIIVKISPAPVIDVGKNQTVCVGVSSQIGSDSLSGDTYSWASNPVGFSSAKAKLVVTPVKTTSYSLTVTSSVGCTNFDSVTITVNPRPMPVAGAPEKICTGTVVQLGDTSAKGCSYSWTSNPKGFISTLSNPVDSPKITTTYTVSETIDSTGCSDSNTVQVTVMPLPNAAFVTKNINGYEYQFTAKSPNYPSWQYHWDFGDTTDMLTDTLSGYKLSHTYPKNGKYHVTLTVSLPGFCTVVDTYTVVINLNFSLNVFPNAFSLQTDINYTIVNAANIRISIVDAIGREICVLKNEQVGPGEYDTYFNGALWKTRPGMYFVLFVIDGKLYVRKIIQLDSIYH